MAVRQEPIRLDPGSSFRFLVREQTDYRFNPHRHAQLELHGIAHGAGTAVLGDHLQRWTAPAAFLVGPGLVHTWQSDPLRVPLPHRGWVLQASAALGERLAGCPEWEGTRPLLAAARRGLVLEGAAAEPVVAGLASFAAADPLARIGLWWQMLAAFAGCRPAAAPQAVGAGHADTLDQLCVWLAEHASDPVTLAGAARRIGMHPQALARSFRRRTGFSLIGYVQRLRLSRAADLLRDSNLPVAACGAEAGIPGSAHFHRLFLRHYGQSPAAWRRALRHS